MQFVPSMGGTHAEIGRRAVSEWLHGKIDPIDREAVQILVLLDQHRRNPAVPPEVTPAKPVSDDAAPQPWSSIPPQVCKARQAAAAQLAQRRWVREQEEAEQRLGQLGSIRHHLIEIAGQWPEPMKHGTGIWWGSMAPRSSGATRTGPDCRAGGRS
jgi:hypothetical protein